MIFNFWSYCFSIIRRWDNPCPYSYVSKEYDISLLSKTFSCYCNYSINRAWRGWATRNVNSSFGCSIRTREKFTITIWIPSNNCSVRTCFYILCTCCWLFCSYSKFYFIAKAIRIGYKNWVDCLWGTVAKLANAGLCKSSIRGFESRRYLQLIGCRLS